MQVVKLVSKPATIYVSSKARPLQLFQMFSGVQMAAEGEELGGLKAP